MAMSACAKSRPDQTLHNEAMTEPLTFGTAGLRGPMRDGPGGMNVEAVTRATWGVAKVLEDRCLGGSTVVVGRDARHNSDAFALATAEVLAAQGFSVILLPDAAPTPAMLAGWSKSCGALETAVRNWQRVATRDLAALNAALGRNHIALVAAPNRTVAAPACAAVVH